MAPALSYEQAPPISVPYRFFLTAPLYGVLAGITLAWYGSEALQSNLTPIVVALTHLIVVGFMLQTMCGSLLQFVAVVAGANIWRPRLIAAVVHPLLTLGALALALGFLFWTPILIQAAVYLLAAGISIFIVVLAIAMLRTPAGGMSIHVIRLALLGLLVTLVLGVALTLTLGFFGNVNPGWDLLALVNVHVAWGLGGWALMLVVGVSYMVVPMFQLTPAYPAALTRQLPAGLFLALCGWTLQLAVAADAKAVWLQALATAGVALAGGYAAATLWLQSRRRRRLTDATFLFWRMAMVSLLIFALTWIAGEMAPLLAEHPRLPLWLGALLLPGVFVAVITGMLYKIVPFLNWLHLQRLSTVGAKLPNMKQMIADAAMRGQMWLHMAACVLLLAAVLWPALAVLAGLAFAASFLLLESNLISAVRVYRRYHKELLHSSGR
jgi:hypothetical protein